jgi:hypothetical protein
VSDSADNRTQLSDIKIEGVGVITHPEACVCAGDCCALEKDDE